MGTRHRLDPARHRIETRPLFSLATAPAMMIVLIILPPERLSTLRICAYISREKENFLCSSAGASQSLPRLRFQAHPTRSTRGAALSRSKTRSPGHSPLMTIQEPIHSFSSTCYVYEQVRDHGLRKCFDPLLTCPAANASTIRIPRSLLRALPASSQAHT